MKRLLPLLVLLAMSAVSAAQHHHPDFYDGQLWVQVRPSIAKGVANDDDRVSLAPFEAIFGKGLCEEYGLTGIRKPFHFAFDNSIREVYQLFFERKGDELAFAAALERLDAVGYAERIPIMRPTFTPDDLGGANAGATNNQWGLHRISAPQAWDISQGNTAIRVAVVDDAVLTNHPDLMPNLVPGRDVADNDNNPMPNTTAMSHGTHVAGIISAATHNSTGVASIGFSIKVIPVKSSNTSQYITDAYAGVVWAYQNNSHVINMSWGGSGYSTTGQNIINSAYGAGCVLVAAAGNDNVTTIFYPAGYNNVISVASTASNDAKSSFSNYGPWVKVSAPGTNIRSTYIGTNFSATYSAISGTSMASPMVAGLAGLVLSVNPQMTQAQVRDCILSTATNINSVNGSFIGQLGTGRINAYQAVLCAQQTINAPPVAVIGSDNPTRCPGGAVQFFGSSMGGLAQSWAWSFPGGVPATSSQQNPLVSYAAVGNYNVSLTVTNSFGADTRTEQGYVDISTNGIDYFFTENFENGTFASNGWQVVNPDNGITWELASVGGSVSGTRAAGVNHFNYQTQGQRDGLVTPLLDFSGHSNIQLDFQHAHRRFSADYRDSLIIYVSTNGGATYPHRVFARAENGTGNFATNSILNQNFVPANGVDWCFGGDLGSGCFTVSLSQFDGQPNVRLKFETWNGYGNNIYVDNIQLSGNCNFAPDPPVAAFSASAVQVCAGQQVQFTDLSANAPTAHQWSFPGGTPATSQLSSPAVVYSTPGTYSVSLTVSNTFGSNQLTQTGYITVSPASSISVSGGAQQQVCLGSGLPLIASGGLSYSWSPAAGLSATSGAAVTASPAATTTYTVTDAGSACSASASVTVTVNPVPDAPLLMMGDDAGFAMLAATGVQGWYAHSYTGTANSWGNGTLADHSAEGQLVVARDGTAADSLLCGNPVNAAQLSGRIAVIYRGECEFGAKALRAQNAGAIGVIIVNNAAGAPIQMGAGANGASVTIPVIMVSQAVGAQLRASINAGTATGVIGRFNGVVLEFCPGGSARLAAPEGYAGYSWSTGGTSAVEHVTQPGQHHVTVFNALGCGTASIPFTVSHLPVTQPAVIDQGDQLQSSASGTAYQWYLNGQPIPGSNAQGIPAQGPGLYTVEVTDANGCVSLSGPYEVIAVGIAQRPGLSFSVFPNPNADAFTVMMVGLGGEARLLVTDLAGRLLLTQDFDATDPVTIRHDWPAGVYLLTVETSAGRETRRVEVVG